MPNFATCKILQRRVKNDYYIKCSTGTVGFFGTRTAAQDYLRDWKARQKAQDKTRKGKK